MRKGIVIGQSAKPGQIGSAVLKRIQLPIAAGQTIAKDSKVWLTPNNELTAVPQGKSLTVDLQCKDVTTKINQYSITIGSTGKKIISINESPNYPKLVTFNADGTMTSKNLSSKRSSRLYKISPTKFISVYNNGSEVVTDVYSFDDSTDTATLLQTNTRSTLYSGGYNASVQAIEKSYETATMFYIMCIVHCSNGTGNDKGGVLLLTINKDTGAIVATLTWFLTGSSYYLSFSNLVRSGNAMFLLAKYYDGTELEPYDFKLIRFPCTSTTHTKADAGNSAYKPYNYTSGMRLVSLGHISAELVCANVVANSNGQEYLLMFEGTTFKTVYGLDSSYQFRSMTPIPGGLHVACVHNTNSNSIMEYILGCTTSAFSQKYRATPKYGMSAYDQNYTYPELPNCALDGFVIMREALFNTEAFFEYDEALFMSYKSLLSDMIDLVPAVRTTNTIYQHLLKAYIREESKVLLTKALSGTEIIHTIASVGPGKELGIAAAGGTGGQSIEVILYESVPA